MLDFRHKCAVLCSVVYWIFGFVCVCSVLHTAVVLSLINSALTDDHGMASYSTVFTYELGLGMAADIHNVDE